MEWTQQGKFDIAIENESFRIFPKDSEGKTRPVWIKRAIVYLKRRDTQDQLFFKYYLHQRRYYWADSRKPKGSVPIRHVRKELARMLYKGNIEAANRLMSQIESLI